MRVRRMRLAALLSLVALLAAGAAPFISPPEAAARTFTTRWGYYITYDPTSLESLRRQVDQLDIVSPYFYELRADGTIQDNSQTTALTIMREAGVEIVPMIKNASRWDDFTTTIGTPAKRDAIVQRLVDLVLANDYDGIHIDFEAVNASDAPLLTDFMQRLSAKLRPLNKLVTQAVIARTSDASTTWGGAYDYPALAKVNDFIVIMAYDYHSVGGGPGPVAPLPWVTNVVRYAKTRIPAPQILLGMPLYGYDWNVTAGPPATSLRYDQTTALLARPGTQSGYDAAQESAWLKYTDDQGDQHEAWYENATSFRAKLNLMIDEEVGGFALWRLGHEDPAVWAEVGNLAKPTTRIPPFPDTPDRRYFPETGHSIAWGFKTFWERSGGLPVFGFPHTEEFSELNGDTGQVHTVQYFERQRFEYHPEFKLTPYETSLGRLGFEDAARRGLLDTAPFQPAVTGNPASGCEVFDVTGHSVCGKFLDYWRSHGLDFGDPGISYRESLALFGYPISEPFVDPDSGLTVQYFERARFEYHPEHAGTPYEVLLGLLGNDAMRAKGWLR